MIYYNNSNINEWNFGDDNIIKVYKHGAVCYYKITSGDTPTPEYKVCFAVVDDITQYQETEFEDVFDNATEKWYKLNNLNEYEEYGVYGSGRTSCEGSTSRLPQGYTEVEYIENTGSSTINTNFYPNTNTRVLCEMEMITTQSYPKLFGAGAWNFNNSLYIEFATSLSVHWIGSTSTYSDYPKSFAFAKHKYDLDKGNLYINDTLVGTKAYSSVVSVSSPLGIFSYINNSTAGNADEHFIGKLYTFKIYDDGTLIRDFVPAKRDSDNVAGLYDIVNDVFYTPMETNIPLVAGDPVTPTDCVTTYKGKLTIDDGYEYEWNGSSWVNLGEVSGSSRVPIGYTEVEYIENTSTAYINLGVNPYSANGNSFMAESTFSSFTQSSLAYLISTECTNQPYYGFILRWVNNNLQLDGASIGIDTTATNIPNGDGTSAITFYSDSTTTSNYNTPITLFCGLNGSSPWRNGKGKCYSFKLTINNNIVRDLVPCKRDSDDKYGAYDIVNDVFYTSPNNVDFIGGSETGSTEYPKYYSEKSEPLDDLTFNTLAEAQTYAYNNCVYDGMKATIDGDRYYFDSSDENGWVKNQHSLPDVPFTVNYNAKQYNASTKTLLKTEGQLADVDAVITAGTPTVHDGYLTIASSTRATISGYQNYFNRTNSTPNLTIISKQRTDGSNCHMFANRDSNYNWMYRCYSNKLTLHGTSEQGSVAVTTQPVIESVRVNSNRLATYNNYTDNTTASVSNFSYGSTNSTATALFAGYAQTTGEWFAGDFYWVYMCQGTLTDEEVQQVIDYNENL